jgi:hypothetical protein
MVLEYLPFTKKHQPAADVVEPKSPVLKEEDEAFLKRLTSEDQPLEPAQPLVVIDNQQEGKGKNAQSPSVDGANKIPLPASPPAVEERKKTPSTKRTYWAYLQNKVGTLPFTKDAVKQQAGSQLHDVASAVKSGESLAAPTVVVSPEEAEKERKDLTSILDQLNLSSVNNRAFSFSKQSQKLMDDFTQVLKDLVNGVPTAYDDLEKLLTQSDKQLREMFDNLPPFLQKLVKSLPTKMTGTLAPGLLAATAEKPGADGQMLEHGHVKRKVPSLKKLIAERGAVTGLLRSILNFLKLRFPAAITGTNVLLSLAVFLLLFVFWYCHKRGRETRLEKERLAAENNDSDESVSASDLDDSMLEEKPDPDVAKAEEILNRPYPPAASGPGSSRS